MRSEGVRLDSPEGCGHVRRHAGNRRHAARDVIEPRRPALPLGIMIALDPHFNGRQHAHGFFFPDLHRAAGAMMRRAVHPRRAHQILAAEQQPRGLRSAQAFASAIAHQRGAVLQVDVRDRENLGGGVHENRHTPGIGHLRDRLRG